MPRKQYELILAQKPHEGARGHLGQMHWLEACLLYVFVVLAMGRRAGKTTLVPFVFLEDMGHLGNEFYQAAYMAQGHPQAKDMFRACKEAWEGGNLVKESHADEGQDRWIELIGINRCKGGKIWFVSGEQGAHPGFHGKGLHRAILDEASLCPREAWTTTLVPMLAGGGKGLVIGSPFPEGEGFGWFEEWWKKGEVGGEFREKDCLSFNAPTECNPTLSDEFIARLRRTCSSKEEEMCLYDGVFAKDLGSVFTNIAEVFVLPAVDQGNVWVHQEWRPDFKYVAGLDFGAKKDYSVLSVFSIEDHPRQVLVARLRGDLHVQIGSVDRILADYHHPILYVEGRESGAYLGPVLRQKYGEGCREVAWTTGGKWDKESAVMRGVDFFQQKAWSLIDVLWQRDEFRLFSRKKRGETSTGWKYEAPSGKHDDSVAATLYAAYGLPFVSREELKLEPESPKHGTLEWYRQFARPSVRGQDGPATLIW